MGQVDLDLQELSLQKWVIFNLSYTNNVKDFIFLYDIFKKVKAINYIWHCREEELHLELNDGGNEDLIKKNKKKKKLGSINIRITMKPMTKEEMNEVLLRYLFTIFSRFILNKSLFASYDIFRRASFYKT